MKFQLNCLIWFFFFFFLIPEATEWVISKKHCYYGKVLSFTAMLTELEIFRGTRNKKVFISFTVSMVYENIKISFNLKRSSSTVHSWHKHLLAIKCLICCYLFFSIFFPHISLCIIFGMNKEESENQPVLSH